VRESERVRGRGEGGKKKDAGRADTFCGEADGNVPSWETTTRVSNELSTVCERFIATKPARLLLLQPECGQ
jgi:hypothetical protein